jgi:hypothetical protein
VLRRRRHTSWTKSAWERHLRPIVGSIFWQNLDKDVITNAVFMQLRKVSKQPCTFTGP